MREIKFRIGKLIEVKGEHTNYYNAFDITYELERNTGGTK